MVSLNKISLDKGNSIFNKKNFICLLLITVVFILDRISKFEIIDKQMNNNAIYVNDFINFELIWNTGIGFGLLSSSSSLIYNLLTALIGGIIIFLIYLLVSLKFLDKILFSIIIGGALGNVYDRIVYYAVPDFIDIHYKNFHWFTFNIADIFITVGILLLILKDVFFKHEK
tara:strand:+ start:1896 stop:2408 length:513 start_codon:yes stop_codon:yes gene_type:complete